MVGFIFGTVCLFALLAQLNRSRFGWYSYGGMRRRPYMGGDYRAFRYASRFCGGGFARGGFRFREHAMHTLFERLATSPQQEEALSEAVRALEGRVRASREELFDMLPDAAALMKQDSFDRTAASALASRAQPVLDGVRDALLEACARVHAALDPDQRRQLARLFEGGRYGGGR